MAADVGGHLIEVLKDLIVGEPHQSLSKTVAAIHGAPVGGQNDHSLGVFVL